MLPWHSFKMKNHAKLLQIIIWSKSVQNKSFWKLNFDQDTCKILCFRPKSMDLVGVWFSHPPIQNIMVTEPIQNRVKEVFATRAPSELSKIERYLVLAAEKIAGCILLNEPKTISLNTRFRKVLVFWTFLFGSFSRISPEKVFKGDLQDPLTLHILVFLG